MNGSFALTWSPNPSFHRECDPLKQMSGILPILNKLKYALQGILTFELNMNGNIHIHASVDHIHDRIKWYKSILPLLKRNGFVKIKGNIDDGWKEYLLKDTKAMEQILGIDKLPVDISSIKYHATKSCIMPELDNGICEFFPCTLYSLDCNNV
nr:MAG TPA: Rep protein [Bacteriophage sp.]